MNTGKVYKTKQREVVFEYLVKNKGNGLTIDEIYEGLKSEGVEIGKTTVYRCLDKLVKDGDARRYAATDGGAGAAATFQVNEAGGNCNHHYHLKCLTCGKILHLECDEMAHINLHIAKEHGFVVDLQKTVLYGYCKTCSKNLTKDTQIKL
ncbi:MAG: transcriptional repressor [Lachnospiraceae bacterium]|nr:transcriptional repressor [Lachnospiraceae bacterium]